MPENWNDLLVRDSLQDTGVVPSPGYPYTSPDIICTQGTTYRNPVEVFGTTSSYAQDPNLPVLERQSNYLYVRAKNLDAQSHGGEMYVYWTTSGLCLDPSRWWGQQLQVFIGTRWQPNNPLGAATQNGVTVSQQPFTWSPSRPAPGEHYCLVGAVGTSLHPWPPPRPPTFGTWEAFTEWVRTNQNICWRNLWPVSDPRAPQWDRVDGLHNSWPQDAPLLLSAECQNIPVGTQVRLRCTALDVDTKKTVTNSTKETIYAAGVTCPGGFDSYVQTTAQLPSAGRWPPGALILTRAYFGTQRTSRLARFAEDFGEDAAHPQVAEALRLAGGVDNGVLVEVGNCGTAYTGSTASVPEG